MIILVLNEKSLKTIRDTISNLRAKELTFKLHFHYHKRFISVCNKQESYKVFINLDSEDIKCSKEVKNFVGKEVFEDENIANVENDNTLDFNVAINLEIIDNIVSISKHKTTVIEFSSSENISFIKSYTLNTIQRYHYNYEIIYDNPELNIIEKGINILDDEFATILNLHYYVNNTIYNKIVGNYTYITIGHEGVEIMSTNGRCMLKSMLKKDVQNINIDKFKTYIPFKLSSLFQGKVSLVIQEEKIYIVSERYFLILPIVYDDFYIHSIPNMDDISIDIEVTKIKEITDLTKKIKVKGKNPTNINLHFEEKDININVYDDIQSINVATRQELENPTVLISLNRDIFKILADILKHIDSSTKTINIKCDEERKYAKMNIDYYNTSIFFVLNKQDQ